MATPHPLIWRQQNFAAKAETTPGTAVALTAAEGKFNTVGDVTVEADFPANERQSPGSMSHSKSKPGAAGASVEFTVESANSGSGTPPQWFSMLDACGFSISGGVATVSSGSATAGTYTCGHYLDGKLFTAAGCMFDLEWTFESGKIPLLKFTGKGIWQAPTNNALITPTYETGTVPVFKGATLTVATTSYIVPRLVLKMNSDVQLREDGTSPTGYRAAVIVNRAPTIEMDVEADTTKDWHADHASEVESAFSCAVGSGTNGIITLAAPKMQLRTPPRKTNKNGYLVWTCDYGLNKSAAAGDDELTLTLS